MDNGLEQSEGCVVYPPLILPPLGDNLRQAFSNERSSICGTTDMLMPKSTAACKEAEETATVDVSTLTYTPEKVIDYRIWQSAYTPCFTCSKT